ncbi:hypothetical protein D3C78_1787730 [compost metagenome]
MPTAPIPVGGGLIYVPVEWVRPADMGVEGLTSVYLSMGLTPPHQAGRLAKEPVVVEDDKPA